MPGRPAPLLVTREMVQGMRPGSVVVDLAAESGGNVEGSVPGQDMTSSREPMERRYLPRLESPVTKVPRPGTPRG